MIAKPAETESGERATRPHASVPSVAICIATCRRPRMFRRLLESLSALDSLENEASIDLVIIENEATGAASDIIREMRPRLPFPVHFGVEPVRNIARARNRGVEKALTLTPAMIVFVDDDEVVEPDWVRRLLAAQAMY